ncbi:restriction endonuclease subunit S, partial [Limnospira sp. PMC 1245.20]
LNEQRRIVAKLDRLFARSRCAREELGRVSGLVQRYKQAVLAAAFHGDLTADWRAENIASTWATIPLSEACLSITDGDHQAPPKVEKGIPFITISAINDGKLNLSKATRFVSKSYFESRSPQRKPAKGDILFSVTGSIGIPVLVDTCELFTFQRHIGILKVNKNLTLEKYLLYILGSEQIKRQGLDVATGTAQLTIPLGGLRNFQIPLPTLEEQKEIVKRVEKLFKVIDIIEQEHQKASKLLDRLEKATLSKAFRGELVPQDPNDEPAAVLLERIQAERQTQPKRKAKSTRKPKAN